MKVTTRLRKPKKKAVKPASDTSGITKKRRTRKRRYRRKRRTTAPTLAKKPVVRQPIPSTSDVTVGTQSDSESEEKVIPKKRGNRKKDVPRMLEKKIKRDDDNSAQGSSSRKARKIVDVITLSDDDEIKKVPVKMKGEKSHQNKATQPKKKKRTRLRQFAAAGTSSDDDSDYRPESNDDEMPSTSTASRNDTRKTKTSASKNGNFLKSDAMTSVPSVPVEVVSQLLFIPPVARAIAKSLPMRSLLSLAQVNKDMQTTCTYERNLARRQNFDWAHFPSIITALNDSSLLHEKDIFGSSLQELYCEPEMVICFSAPKIMFGHKLRFDDPRSPDFGERKDVCRILSDLMPKDARKILHIRTQGVLPPLPSIMTGNPRKIDHWGCKTSARDLSVLVFPKINGVNIWREHLTEAELRVQLKNNGWLENRSHNHFLLPMIKELEIVAPKLVIMFTRRFAHHSHVLSSEFPVLVLNTVDNLGEERYSSHGDPTLDYGLEWLAFGGKDCIAYQVALDDNVGQMEHARVLRQLRDQFTAQQVMGGRMLLFYFSKVNQGIRDSAEMDRLYEQDVKQLREEFPRVPIFGGSYPTVIGSVFTKDKADGNFGKFFHGASTSFVSAVILGQH
ncbi:uncharacterized protein LOC129581862 isoform X2 [Paramacrobiotus metropolitanus]|nr:uncharacterized protein LOC129581862 isoform X2 [Paramacrobiotus metropolitanus]